MSVEEMVKRLRDQMHLMQRDGIEALLTTAAEAADKLEELAAEVGRWQEAAKVWFDLACGQQEARRKAEAALAEKDKEIAAIKRALTLIDALDPEEHVYGCSAYALRGIVIQMGQLARNAGGKDAE